MARSHPIQSCPETQGVPSRVSSGLESKGADLRWGPGKEVTEVPGRARIPFQTEAEVVFPESSGPPSGPRALHKAVSLETLAARCLGGLKLSTSL